MACDGSTSLAVPFEDLLHVLFDPSFASDPAGSAVGGAAAAADGSSGGGMEGGVEAGVPPSSAAATPALSPQTRFWLAISELIAGGMVSP